MIRLYMYEYDVGLGPDITNNLTGRWKIMRDENKCAVYVEVRFSIFRRKWLSEREVYERNVYINKCGRK